MNIIVKGEKYNLEVKVIQILLDKYICIDKTDKIITCVKSGNMKKQKVYVGDNANVIISSNTYVITEVLSRSNFVIRPPVANIDTMILCVSAKSPEPDYILLDKQIILCLNKNIKPIICVTKTDLDKENKVLNYIESVYGKYYDIISVVATLNKGIDKLKNSLNGKTAAFSGNSGVGKSSIVNLLNPDHKLEIGDIGLKSNKGKHTTKEVRLFNIAHETFILDTPGFSSYEVFDVTYKELTRYFKQFESCNCKYLDCRHTKEKEDVCDVKYKVLNNEIDKDLYERYIYIYNELYKKDTLKYK